MKITVQLEEMAGNKIKRRTMSKYDNLSAIDPYKREIISFNALFTDAFNRSQLYYISDI
jgi:regulator of sigma D